ncbi:MAG: SdrD B-like domain-containing protein, partial [Desulfocapsaceae bacterium]|nr:SdrD B-like domain-containing protein [Desulfocapsaceae bacterium]
MYKPAFRRLTALFCLLLAILHSQTANAAADIQPTSFLDNPDPVPARGEVTYSVVVKSNDQANPVTAAWLEIPLPTGFTFVSINDAGCSYSGSTPSIGGNDKIRCDWATITSQKNIDFHLLVPDVTAIYTLTATTGAAVDSNPGNNTEMVTTQVVTSADLQLTSKTGTPNPAPGGSIVTYDFTVTNNGPYPASALTLADVLPPGLSFVADNANPVADQDNSWNCSAVGQTVTCTAASLASSATSIFHFRVQVTTATTGSITNAASVSASTADPEPDNNTATHDLTIIEGTDMAIAKSVATSPVIGGQPVQFTLTATNNGPMTAASLTVTDTLPSGYTAIAMISTPAGWNCNIDAISDPAVITCSIASVAAGAGAVFTITATPPTVANSVTHQNSAQVATTTTDPIGSNNDVTVNYDVNPDIADLSITKTKSPSPVAQGSDITSTIVVHNSGPRPADPVQVVDVLSGGETFVSYSGANWTCAHNGVNPGGTVTCAYNSVPLANGADTASLTIITTATNAGVLTNTACTGGVGGSTVPGYGDTNTGNNCAGASVTSTSDRADLVVDKITDDNDLAPTENSFTYTITVRNDGPQTAQAVDFRDTIPQYAAAGTGGRPATSLSATPSQGTCTITNALVQCNLGDIASGATITVPITVTRPMQDGTLTNTASAYSTLTGDPDRSNNTDSVAVTVQPITDIEVTDKAVTYAEQPDPILAGTIATYTIQVRNNGPSTAQTVTLADVFSGEAFDFIDASVAGGGSCAYTAATTTLNCTLNDMGAGTTKAITMRIRPDHNVTPVGPWQIDNIATVSMVTTDSNPANNNKTANLPIVLGVADLAITKNESPSFTEPVRFVPSGTNYIVYEIKIANSGPSLATGVTFTDKMTNVSPATGQSLKFIEDTADLDGTPDPLNICDTVGTTFVVGAGTSPTITCALANDPSYPQGRLASGASYTRYLVFEVLDSPDAVSGDSYHDEATVTAHETEPTPANNTENENTTVRTVADLGLVKTASKTPVEVEESFSYTLTVTNHGPGKSPETTVTDTLPSGMVLTGPPVPATGTCTGIAGNTSLSCDLGLMDSGAIVTITVPVKVTAWTATKQNCSSVTSLAPEPDPDTNSNQGCVTINVQQPATLGDFVWLDSNANGRQDGGEPGTSGVTVNLLDNGGTQVATTTTNGSGLYSFTINHAAAYHVEVIKPATYFISPKDATTATDATDSDTDIATGRTDAITVNYGDAITTVDAGLYQQVSLGDRVWHDSDADGTQDAGELGIPGITVTLYSAGPDNTFWTGDDVTVSSTTTDATGLYIFSSLTPGDYAVQITPPTGLGFLPSPVQTADPDNNSNTDSNIDLATAPPIGSYRSGVITLSSQSEPATDGDADTNTNLTLDLGLVLPGSIGNLVWLDEDSNGKQDAGEPGIANVTVQLRNSAGTLIATTTTDAHGGYLFTGVTPGTYFVKVLAASLATGLSQTTAYSTAGADFGNQNQTPANGYSLPITSGGKNLTADFGYNWSPTADVTGGTNTGAIGNRVWIDHDGDGIQDPGETGVKGVELTLFRAGADGLFWTGDDVSVTTTTTADDGSYIFDGLAAGAYAVKVTASGAASHDILNSAHYTQTGDPDHFAAGTVTAQAGTAGDHESTIPIILAPGDTFINADFGYQPTGATLNSIGNTVWLDSDRDGIMDPSESGIEGVVVGLKNGAGNFIATTTTNAGGLYLFTDLPDGTYTVAIIDSENMLTGLKTTYDQDSGITNPDGQSTVTLSGSDNLDQNFGFVPRSAEAGTGAVGDTIFLDRDADNTVDPGEGMEGVRVYLKNDIGTVILATTFTNKNGRYFFGGLTAWTYTVAVDTSTLPAGLTNTVDPDGGTVSTSSVTILAAGIDMIQDFGYRAATPGTIGNLAWKDRNADGVYDANGLDNILGNADDETPLAGVSIELYRDLDNDLLIDFNEPLIAVTTTDAGGAYQFSQLPAGRYNVKVSDTSNVLEGFWHSLGTAGTNNNSQADYYGVNLTAGAAIVVADFGYYYQPGSTGNRVWKDEDVNGLYDGGTDSAIANVSVNLAIQYPNGTTTTIKTLTDGNGSYLFQNLLLDENHNGIGSYGTGGNEPRHTITVDETTIPAPLVSIYPTRTRNTDSTTVGGAAGDEDTNDFGSDTPGGEPGYPPKGSLDITNDFGYFTPSSLGDKVWNDSNGNGIQDIGESGRMGVSVHLLDGSGNPVNNPLLPGVPYILPTDANGNYRFTYLLPGTYQVQFVLPADTGFTTQNSGGDDALDSDPDPATGKTATITLGIGEDNLTVDAGLIGAAINIKKATNGQDVDSAPGVLLAVGDAITWSYVVTNTGNAALSGVTVTDDKIGVISCPQTTLAVAEAMTCTASGTAVAGQYANIGSVVASPPTGAAVFDSDPSHYLAANPTGPAIDIEKATNGEDADTGSGPVIAVGNTVTWSYVVTNTGNTALTSVAVTDDKIGVISCPMTALALAESMTCTAMGTAVAGQYTNIGSVTATPPSGPNVTDTDPSHYFGSTGSNFAAIDLEKSTNNQDADSAPGPYIEISSPVTWRYVVTNTGSTTLTGVTVTDDIVAGTDIHCPDDGNTDNIISSLAAGASVTCTASGTAAIGQYSNTGSVTGTPPTGPAVTDTDPSHYFGSSSQIDLKKYTNGQDADTGTGPYLVTGSAVNWTYIVTNTGNTQISGVTVTDDKGVAISCPATILAAGASMTCTGSGTAIAGQYANIGTVVGTSLAGTIVTDTDPSHYFGS